MQRAVVCGYKLTAYFPWDSYSATVWLPDVNEWWEEFPTMKEAQGWCEKQVVKLLKNDLKRKQKEIKEIEKFLEGRTK